MIDIMLAIWLVFFIIFLVVNIITNNEIFGLMAGFLLLLLSLFILVDGIQISDTIEIVTAGSTTSVSWVYEDATLPYGNYNTVFGVSFLLFAVYIIYANLIKKPSG